MARWHKNPVFGVPPVARIAEMPRRIPAMPSCVAPLGNQSGAMQGGRHGRKAGDPMLFGERYRLFGALLCGPAIATCQVM